MTFYRKAFAQRGLTEIKRLTNITEKSNSLVFSGANDSKVVVLQSIDLAYSTDSDLRNITLSTEKRTWDRSLE